MDNSWMTLEPTDQEMEAKSIFRWMKKNLEDHRDPRTSEINSTILAEECALELYPGEWLSDTHLVWDIAVDIADEDEKRRNKKCPECGMTVERIEDGVVFHIDPTAAPCEE